MLLKFGGVLSIICGFLMEVSCWRCILQCIVIMQSFLRLLKLLKLAVFKLDLSRGGLTRCHSVLDHGLNLHHNIPLNTVDSPSFRAIVNMIPTTINAMLGVTVKNALPIK